MFYVLHIRDILLKVSAFLKSYVLYIGNILKEYIKDILKVSASLKSRVSHIKVILDQRYFQTKCISKVAYITHRECFRSKIFSK